MNRFLDEIILGVGVAIALIASYWLGQQAYGWMPPAATVEAQRVDSLFSFLVSIGGFIFLGVTGMIGWSLLTCRAQRGDFSEGHPARGNVALEVCWTLAPTLLVLWVAVQSQHIYQLLNLEGLHLSHQPQASEMSSSQSMADQQGTVGVVAKQWPHCPRPVPVVAQRVQSARPRHRRARRSARGPAAQRVLDRGKSNNTKQLRQGQASQAASRSMTAPRQSRQRCRQTCSPRGASV